MAAKSGIPERRRRRSPELVDTGLPVEAPAGSFQGRHRVFVKKILRMQFEGEGLEPIVIRDAEVEERRANEIRQIVETARARKRRRVQIVGVLNTKRRNKSANYKESFLKAVETLALEIQERTGCSDRTAVYEARQKVRRRPEWTINNDQHACRVIREARELRRTNATSR